MNPNLFYTPPAPQLTISYNQNGTATLNWLPSPGPVTGYTLEKFDWQTFQTTGFNLSANSDSFEDDLSSDEPYDPSFYGPQLYVDYQIVAHYGGGDSSAGSASLGFEPYVPFAASLVQGPQGGLGFVASAVPSDLNALRLYRVQDGRQYSHLHEPTAEEYGEPVTISANSPLADDYLEIPVASMTNGVFSLPGSQASPYYTYHFWVQTVRSNGVSSDWFGRPGN